MAQQMIFGSGSRVIHQGNNGRLKPCYLVLQPIKWCKRFKHKLEFKLCWRQCDFHYHQGNDFALCRPRERENLLLILRHDHIEDPSCEESSEVCRTCMDMKGDAYLSYMRDKRVLVRHALESENLEPDARATLESSAAELDVNLNQLVAAYQDINNARVEAEARQLIQANPVLQLHKGHVDATEASQRPQYPYPTPARVLIFAQHEIKKMQDW